jgi:hypothetical protein
MRHLKNLNREEKIPEIFKKISKILKIFKKILRDLNICHFFSTYLPLGLFHDSEEIQQTKKSLRLTKTEQPLIEMTIHSQTDIHTHRQTHKYPHPHTHTRTHTLHVRALIGG